MSMGAQKAAVEFGTTDEYLKEKEGWNFVLTQYLIQLNKEAVTDEFDKGYEHGVVDGLTSLPDDAYKDFHPHPETIRWANYAKASIMKLDTNSMRKFFNDSAGIADPPKVIKDPKGKESVAETYDDFIFWVMDLNPAIFNPSAEKTHPVVKAMNFWRVVLLKRALANILADMGWHFRVTPMGKQTAEGLDRHFKDYKPRNPE